MSPELEDQLHDKYPKIFKRKIGLGCDDGWYNIIDTLCKNIQHYLDYKLRDFKNEEEKEALQVVAVQIKEKWGSLRFYYDGSCDDDYISGLVRMSEAFSVKTCEICGNKSEVQTKGWIRNVCNSCNQK